MPTSPRSAEIRILRHLLRLLPYPMSALLPGHARVLMTMRERGLVDMDAWGVVSLTHRGERAALGMP